MRIKELEWIIKNWDKLSDFEQKWLGQYNLRAQYDSGELNYSYNEMMELFKLIDNIYNRYNREDI
jgi:hypothetical protein